MLVVESVRDRNEFFIPAIIARLVATNQQNRAAARVERKEHAIGPARMLNPKFLHVRVPRRMNQISVRPRKAWSEFLQQNHFRVHIGLFVFGEAGPSTVYGSGTDALHTDGFAITEAAERLAPTFIKHGYAFLYLFRRGQGLSADQGFFMQDMLQREKDTKGGKARKRLQFVLLTTDHLDDVTAGLSFLKSLPGVDSRRIAVVGHSFGGQLTLLAAERDSTLRAAVTFSAAASSWESSSEVRESMLTAVRNATVPTMLLHAENDYSTAPGKAMANELARLGKPHVLKIYPPVGRTADDGHNFVYTAVPEWEGDVFGFLDQYVRR
jgi:carboxymethylenebutenolidase